jgi:hypothetical protein
VLYHQLRRLGEEPAPFHPEQPRPAQKSTSRGLHGRLRLGWPAIGYLRNKEEALERMIMLGERALCYAIRHYLSHHHTERNHQGLDNRLIYCTGGVPPGRSDVLRNPPLSSVDALLRLGYACPL